jgi:hypothetical protein
MGFAMRGGRDKKQKNKREWWICGELRERLEIEIREKERSGEKQKNWVKIWGRKKKLEMEEVEFGKKDDEKKIHNPTPTVQRQRYANISSFKRVASPP